MLALFLAILSSTLVTVVMRVSETRSKNRTSLLAVNYLVCSVLSAAFTGTTDLLPAAQILPTALLLGLISGALYLGGFLLLQWNINRNGVVLPATFMKLGVIVPTLMAILVFREAPRLTQVVGIIAAVAAIIFMKDKTTDRPGSTLGLILLLLCGGLCDSMSNVYMELSGGVLKDHYLLYTFVTAMLLCVGLCLVRRERLAWQDLLWGTLLAVPNYFSALFLIDSLATVPAVVAFPSFSVGTIVMVTLAGMLLFGERLKTRKWIAMGVIAVALILLNV